MIKIVAHFKPIKSKFCAVGSKKTICAPSLMQKNIVLWNTSIIQVTKILI